MMSSIRSNGEKTEEFRYTCVLKRYYENTLGMLFRLAVRSADFRTRVGFSERGFLRSYHASALPEHFAFYSRCDQFMRAFFGM